MTAVLRAEEPSARYLVEVEPPLTRGFEVLATAPGGISKMRELVLAMALLGKLTRPEAGDSSVDHLLAEIAGRREQRVASGEMRGLYAVSCGTQQSHLAACAGANG